MSQPSPSSLVRAEPPRVHALTSESPENRVFRGKPDSPTKGNKGQNSPGLSTDRQPGCQLSVNRGSIRAISLWQPYASAIAASVKLYETRGWPTDYRGPLAIHAAQRDTRELRRKWESEAICLDWFRKIGIHSYADLPRGCIVATCEVIDCVPTEVINREHRIATLERRWGDYRDRNDGPKENGKPRYAWKLANIVALTTPFPCVGRQGFFTWEDAG